MDYELSEKIWYGLFYFICIISLALLFDYSGATYMQFILNLIVLHLAMILFWVLDIGLRLNKK